MSDKPKTEGSPAPSAHKATAAHGEVKVSGAARPRIRKIRHSPVTDPKKLEAARASAQKLKLKKLQAGQVADGTDQGADNLDDLEIPLITPGL